MFIYFEEAVARPISKRDSILQGVLEVVARKGLTASTIQDIASASGVSAGLLYRYWSSRDALAADVYRTNYQGLVERLGVAQARVSTAWEKLDAMLDTFLRFADEQPVVLRFLLLCQHELVHSIPAEMGVRRLLQGVFEEGIRSGVMRAMSSALSIHLALGIVLQPVIGVIYGHLDGPIAAYADEIRGALRRVLGSHSAASSVTTSG